MKGCNKSCETTLLPSCSREHQFLKYTSISLRNFPRTRRALRRKDEDSHAQIQLPARCDKMTFCASPVAACETSRLVTLSLAVMARETRSQLRWRQTLPMSMRLTVSFNTRAAALVKSDVSQGSGRIGTVRAMRNCPRLS
jgi:hypothetical protein